MPETATRICGREPAPSTGKKRWNCCARRRIRRLLLLEIEADEKVNPVEKMGEVFREFGSRTVAPSRRLSQGDPVFTAAVGGRRATKSYVIPVTTIADIGKHEGQTVTIRGWLYNLRESGKLLFPQFRDGCGLIQGVVPKNAVPPEVFDAIKGLTQESSVIVEGKVRADKRAPGDTSSTYRRFRSCSGSPRAILIRFRRKSTASIS